MDESIMFVVLFSGIWGILGLIFFLIGIAILNNRNKKEVNCTSTTFGKIMDIVEHESHSRNSYYSSSWHPVFEYNIGELKFIKESIYGSSQSKYAIGQNVEIHYNPDNYNEYYVTDETLPRTLGKIFIFIGIIGIIIAILSAVLILKIFKEL